MDDLLHCTLLLVEDDPSDVVQLTELLARTRVAHRLVHVASVAEAVAHLRHDGEHLDVVLLDLGLPDGRGVPVVETVAKAPHPPIIVLTGSDDDSLARACLEAGAQDYLCKSDVRAHALERAIGYAISRAREAQVRELASQLAGYRALASSSQAPATPRALAEREPGRFAELVAAYLAVLAPYLRPGDARDRGAMQLVVSQLGDLVAGPGDLLDVHVNALSQWSAAHEPRARSGLFEARLLALQMMGLLVDYYRVGQRPRRTGGLDNG